MVRQPKESSYVKSSTRINDMKTVYEMRHLQHLGVAEIISRTGIKRGQIYKYLRIFAAEYPDLVEQMKKKREDVAPDEYQKLHFDFNQVEGTSVTDAASGITARLVGAAKVEQKSPPTNGDLLFEYHLFFT